MFIVRDERESSRAVARTKIVAEAMSMVKFVYDDYQQSKPKKNMTEASASVFLIIATALSGSLFTKLKLDKS